MVSYSEELTQERKMTEFTDFRNKISWDNIYDVYRFGKVIGNGKFGIVRLANSKIDPNLTFAIKSIYRRAFKEDQTEIKAELEVMRSVDHPNIVKLIEVYVDSEHVHLVMEHCSGGELFEMITTKGKFSEYDAKKLIQKIFKAIKHLHDKGICHRDIKPENMLFSSRDPDAEIKLIDFGLSRFLKHDEKLTNKVGTPYYVAPEVLAGNYDRRCDLWSIGVITYIILCGYPPFHGSNNHEIFDRIKKQKYSFYVEDWDEISFEAKDFISKLLLLNPSDRITPKEALRHPWMEIQKQKKYLSKKVINNLRKF